MTNTTINGNGSHTVNVQPVVELLNRLKSEREFLDQRIASTEEVLKMLGHDVPMTAAPLAIAAPAEEHEETISVHGMSYADALRTIARANNGTLDVRVAAEIFMDQGVGNFANPDSAAASLFYHLKRMPDFKKIASNTFHLVKPVTTNGHIPEVDVTRYSQEFIASLRDMSYPEALRAIAKANNGVLRSIEAKSLLVQAKPGSANVRVSSAISSALTSKHHHLAKDFQRIENGVYRYVGA